MLTIDKMTCDLWINKWRPNNIDDIIGNKINISNNLKINQENIILLNCKELEIYHLLMISLIKIFVALSNLNKFYFIK